MKMKSIAWLLGFISLDAIAGICSLESYGSHDYFAHCGINPNINLIANNPSAIGFFARDHLPFPLVNYKRTLTGSPVGILDQRLARRGVCFALVVKGFSNRLKQDVLINEEGKMKRVYRIDNSNVGVIIEVGDGKDFTAIDRINNKDTYATNSFCTRDGINIQARLTPVLLSTQPIAVEKTIHNISNAAVIEVVRAPYARPGFERDFSNFRGFKGNTRINISLTGFSFQLQPQTCKITSPNNINLNLPTVAAKDIKAGKRYGGKFNIRMECPRDVNEKYISTYITFTDSSNPSNRGNILSLTKDSSAKGVGIQLYQGNNPIPISYGADSSKRNNLNQILLGKDIDTRTPHSTFYAYYAHSGGVITPGTVKAIATYTLSYQ